jgi:uncharacterized membrane protein YfcA
VTAFSFILIALFGLGVGILSGMFGIGGGTMMVPLLHLVFRLPILSSTATALFVIAPTSVSGALRHLRQGTVKVRPAVTIGLAGAAAAVCSAFISDRLPEFVILAVTACVILYSAYSIIRGALKMTGDTTASEDTPAQSRFTTVRTQYAAYICLGLFAGSVAGIAGVGGGFIIVPISIAYFGYDFKTASGTSLLAIAFLALPGILTHAALGHIWYLEGIALMLGTIPGANIGARLITKIPERVARFTFGGLLILSGIMLVINSMLFEGR